MSNLAPSPAHVLSQRGRLGADERRALDLIFWRDGADRATLAERLGASRSKANGIVASLIGRGYVEESGARPSRGGRPSEALALARGLGVVAAVDVGATSLETALLAPDLSILARLDAPNDVREGPEATAARIEGQIDALLAAQRLTSAQVIGVGVGVPGPVDEATGMLVEPPLMPGWDLYSLRERLSPRYGCPVVIDNDVNVMALGVHWRLGRALKNFLVIKIGTGIGCGVVCGGALYRGATGSAGDVGHICIDPKGPVCRCGARGCVEAMAAGPAIARMAETAARSGVSAPLAARLAEAGVLAPEDVGAAARAGDAASLDIVREAGVRIGQMLAAVVNFHNPSHVFIAGGVAQIGPLFLASIRQSVYQRSLALSTRHLTLEAIPPAEGAGLTGAGVAALRGALMEEG
jgi:glucokinase-like ROK family protein